MAYPPDVPEGTRLNTTGQVDLHPADHNEIHTALTDIINVLGADPGGPYVDVSTAIANILANALVPPGVPLIDLGGDPTPSGWVKCRGGTAAKADMPLTYARFGDKYGPSTEFEFYLPDFRRRVPVGADPTVAIFDTIGETGGSQDAVVVSHQHVVNPPQTAVTNPFGGGQGFLGTGTAGSFDFTIANSPVVYGFTRVDTLLVDIAQFNSASTGEAGTNKNLQPYIVVDYIIRQV